MEPTSEITCKNCENRFDATFHYCPYCSQDVNDDVTLKTLFHNTISNYFSVDARFFRSFIPLMFKPGLLPKRFVGGKRMLYLHPAQTYLFISVVFFFLFSFVAREQEQKLNSAWDSTFGTKDIVNSENPEVEPVKIGLDEESNDEIILNQGKIDSLVAVDAPEEQILQAMGLKKGSSKFEHRLYSQALKVYKHRGNGIFQAYYNSIPIALFILLPIFAFLLKLFYYKKGRFAHHLVFSFYFFSFMFVVFSILLIAGFIWETMPTWLTILVLLSTYFYFWFGSKRFYGQSLLVTFFKSSLVAFLFLSFVVPLSAIVMGFTTFLFY